MGTATSRWLRVVAALAPALWACGGGVQFNGKARAPQVSADQLLSPSSSGEVMGVVQADCERKELREGESIRWSDVVCSPELCERALRERAAAVGATALGPVEWDAESDAVHCEVRAYARPAEVGQASPLESATLSPTFDPSGSVVPGGPARGRAGKAWEVVLAYQTLYGGLSGPARSAENVAFLLNEPVGRNPMGRLSAACESSACTYDDLRLALRSGAGSMGATWMSAVSCQEYEARLRCVADVGAGAL